MSGTRSRIPRILNFVDVVQKKLDFTRESEKMHALYHNKYLWPFKKKTIPEEIHCACKKPFFSSTLPLPTHLCCWKAFIFSQTPMQTLHCKTIASIAAIFDHETHEKQTDQTASRGSLIGFKNWFKFFTEKWQTSNSFKTSLKLVMQNKLTVRETVYKLKPVSVKQIRPKKKC